jgi:hypothetical protein
MPFIAGNMRAVALTGSDQTVSAVPVLYRGFSIRETAGSTATLRVYDNTSASGTLLDTISLAPGESVREDYASGIEATIGIFVDILTGTIEGSLRVT